MTYEFIGAAAGSFVPGGNGAVSRVVMHLMEAPQKVGTARAVANYFASGAGGRHVSAHFCVTPETPVLRGDLRWMPAGDLGVGDTLVGVEEFTRSPRGRTYRPAEVEAVLRRRAECVRVTLADGRVLDSSRDHMWLASVNKRAQWVAADALVPGDLLNAPMKPWMDADPMGSAYLAGFLDGEGTIHRDAKEISVGQAMGPVLDRVMALLDEHEIKYRLLWREPRALHHKKMGTISISGIESNMRILGEARPTRFMDRSAEIWEGRYLGSRSHPGLTAVVSVEHLGEREVVSLATSARTYIANGVVSHNCVDPATVIQCARLSDLCYHAPPNGRSVGIEQAGYDAGGGGPTVDWSGAAGQAELALSAQVAAEVCQTFGLPAVWLSPQDLAAGRRGITSHNNVSLAFGQSSHTDPQPFPVEEFVALVATKMGSVPPAQPAPQGVRVVPQYNPPLLPIVAELDWPAGGVLAAAVDGSVYAWGGAPFLGGCNGHAWFAGRQVARLEYFPENAPVYPGGPEFAHRDGYVVVATSGERYGLFGQPL